MRGVGRLVKVARAAEAGPGEGAPNILVVCPPPFGGHQLAPAFREVCDQLGCELLDLDGVATYSDLDDTHLEEAGHLAKVLALLESRGLSLGRDGGDPYAQALRALVRQPPAERLLDQLLVSALIELRSRERLQLLADNLPERHLRDFYEELAQAEAGHGSLFLRLARKVAPDGLEERLAVLAAAEARFVRELPVRAAIH